MPVVIIPSFAGEVPRTTPRLLEQTQAMVAVNCELSRGHLEPLRGPLKVQALTTGARAIFRHSTDGWLTWARPVRALKSAIVDVDGDAPLGHLLVLGDNAYPTQYLAGGDVCRLGLPRPGTAPKVEVDDLAVLINTTHVYGVGAATAAEIPARYGVDVLPNVEGDGITLNVTAAKEEDVEDTPPEVTIKRSTAYCYTLVRSLAGGVIQQESAPSPPSEVVDVEDGAGCRISEFAIPDVEGIRVTHIRIYRTVSGLQTSDFRFLVELPAEAKEYLDTQHDKDVSTEILRTSLWDAIPDDAQGLIKTDNGLYAAFRGNELLISEPFIPYAFPEAYRLTVEDSIVALGHVDGTIIVLTKGRPYLASGSVPESLQLTHLPIEQACVSAASVASLPGGVVYASPDGLMLFTTSEQTLASAQTFTREQWQALRPESIMGTVHDGRYVAFFEDSNRGFSLNVGARDLVQIELSEGWRVRCLYHHSEDDAVYIGCETPSGHGIFRLEAGEAMPYRWRSKPFFTSALCCMSTLRAEGEQRGGNPVTLSVFGPGGDRARARLRLTDSRARRIPATKAEKQWSVEAVGTAPIFELRLGSSMEGVEYGG